MHPISFIILLVLLPGLGAPVQGGSTTQLDNGDFHTVIDATAGGCLLYTSPSPRDGLLSRMPSSA